MIRAIVSLCVLVQLTRAQSSGSFALPTALQQAQRPVVSDDIAHFFELAPQQRQFIDMLVDRPGFVPQASFQTQSEAQRQQTLFNEHLRQQQQQNSALFGFAPGSQVPSDSFGSFGTLPQGVDPAQVAAAFGQQLSQPTSTDRERSPALGSSSSIRGIPNITPNLPKPPPPGAQTPQRPTQFGNIPAIMDRPPVPQGGLGPLASSSIDGGNIVAPTHDVFTPQFASPNAPSTFDQQVNQFGAATQQQPGGLFGGLMSLLGLGPKPATPQGDEKTQSTGDRNQELLNNFRKALASNAGSDGGIISNVLYNALTAGSVQNNVSVTNESASVTLNNQTAKAISDNFALIQQLITQPNSPLCNPRPTPVSEFDVNAFMGTWYQVLYSPPVSIGPCSMIAYNKLADVANGGPGTVFDTFKYTTEGTPFGTPRISSGYAIVRAPGQLIYRTSASETDVSVNVIGTGPINALGQYEWVLLSENCNYPLHAFARDPVVYKQKYETQVNSLLTQSGLTNGISRLLNVVSPVDTTLCSFPPTLFNIQG